MSGVRSTFYRKKRNQVHKKVEKRNLVLTIYNRYRKKIGVID